MTARTSSVGAAVQRTERRGGRGSAFVRFRRRWLLLAMGVVVASPVAAQDQSDSAEALTMLQRPLPDDREATLSWFGFLLPRIVRNAATSTARCPPPL